MVICLERDADLHVAQLMPLPLTVSCFTKIQIGFTFLVPAHPGSPGKRTVKRVCVCKRGVCVWQTVAFRVFTNFDILLSVISGSRNPKYDLDSFITSLFIGLSSFIKKRMTAKSSE